MKYIDEELTAHEPASDPSGMERRMRRVENALARIEGRREADNTQSSRLTPQPISRSEFFQAVKGKSNDSTMDTLKAVGP